MSAPAVAGWAPTENGGFVPVHDQKTRQEFSRRLIAAHETKRRGVAAELHDGLGQALAMIKNSALSATQNAHDLPSAKEQIEQITEQSAQPSLRCARSPTGCAPTCSTGLA
ncbi:MAG: histidine kinase [Chthoniobacterales bacterium]